MSLRRAGASRWADWRVRAPVRLGWGSRPRGRARSRNGRPTKRRSGSVTFPRTPRPEPPPPRPAPLARSRVSIGRKRDRLSQPRGAAAQCPMGARRERRHGRVRTGLRGLAPPLWVCQSVRCSWFPCPVPCLNPCGFLFTAGRGPGILRMRRHSTAARGVLRRGRVPPSRPRVGALPSSTRPPTRQCLPNPLTRAGRGKPVLRRNRASARDGDAGFAGGSAEPGCSG